MLYSLINYHNMLTNTQNGDWDWIETTLQICSLYFFYFYAPNTKCSAENILVLKFRDDLYWLYQTVKRSPIARRNLIWKPKSHIISVLKLQSLECYNIIFVKFESKAK